MHLSYGWPNMLHVHPQVMLTGNTGKAVQLITNQHGTVGRVSLAVQQFSPSTAANPKPAVW